MDKYDDDTIQSMVDRFDFIFSCLKAEMKEYGDKNLKFEFKKTVPIRNENRDQWWQKKGHYVWAIKSHAPEIEHVFITLQPFTNKATENNINASAEYAVSLYTNTKDISRSLAKNETENGTKAIIHSGWIAKDSTIEYIDTVLSYAFSPEFKRVLLLAKKQREQNYYRKTDNTSSQELNNDEIV